MILDCRFPIADFLIPNSEFCILHSEIEPFLATYWKENLYYKWMITNSEKGLRLPFPSF